MQVLGREAAQHQTLARAVGFLGDTRFWRALVTLLHGWVPFDNALAASYPAAGAPELFGEFDLNEAPPESPLGHYLDGMYLLDPFYQASHEGLPDGLYRLDDVAPDRFHDSEYFRSYFRRAVGEDELQFLVAMPIGTLSLSLGKANPFSEDEVGSLLLASPWILALMRKHGVQMIPSPEERSSAPVAERIQQALADFGGAVLSEREMEVAKLVLRGYSSKGIADKLSISPETVKVHRRHLYAKLDISSQPELFSLFLQALGSEPSAGWMNEA